MAEEDKTTIFDMAGGSGSMLTEAAKIATVLNKSEPADWMQQFNQALDAWNKKYIITSPDIDGILSACLSYPHTLDVSTFSGTVL